MKHILILGHSFDIHISSVAWLLRARGHKVSIWRMEQFPATQSASLMIGQSGESAAFDHLEWLGEPVDTVWRRRGANPTLAANLHPADHAVAMRESRLFVDNAIALIAPEAKWVNPAEGRRRAMSKALQLREARAVGFDIPETLMSNNADSIAAFVRRHKGRVIIKSFYPAAWHSAAATHVFYARIIEPETLEDRFALSAAPAIYQALVPKAYELRITVMGQSCFAARIDAPAGEERVALDWKQDLHAREVSECALPLKLQQMCLAFMRRLGIVFGCLDVIRRPDGVYTFLEVNEMGAFLWLEEYQPSMRLLSAFCDFLCDPDIDAKASRCGNAPGFDDFRASDAFAAYQAEETEDGLAHQYAIAIQE